MPSHDAPQTFITSRSRICLSRQYERSIVSASPMIHQVARGLASYRQRACAVNVGLWVSQHLSMSLTNRGYSFNSFLSTRLSECWAPRLHGGYRSCCDHEFQIPYYIFTTGFSKSYPLLNHHTIVPLDNNSHNY